MLGALAFVGIVVAVGYRITIGVDLSDESYYLGFIDVWFKEGFARNPLLTVHQTAALIVYPLAAAYRHVTGSTDGLVLFLRAVYVAGNCAAALFTLLFLRRVTTRTVAWLGAALVVAFIPFGLPAPSYNTLGEQAMIAGMMTFGCALLDAEARRAGALRWLAGSAAAWTLAVVAYPTLLAVLIVQIGAAWAVAPSFRRPLAAYAGVCAVLQGAAWLAVWSVLTPSHLHDVLGYNSECAGTAAFARKLGAAAAIFSAHRSFAATSVLALAVGVFRNRLGAFATGAAQCALAATFLFFTEPVLFIRTHDAVFALALTGVGLLAGLRSPSARQQTIALLYGTALVAGLVTTATTSANTLFNFAVGGVAAAVLAVSAPRSGANPRAAVQIAPALVLLSLMLSISVRFHYGETPEQGAEPRVRIDRSVYAGLLSSASQAHLISTAIHALSAVATPGGSIVVIGRTPGLYLLTPSVPFTTIEFPLSGAASCPSVPTFIGYYSDPANRPTVVAAYADDYFSAANPFGERFSAWYAVVARYDTPPGSLTIYRRRSSP